MEDEEGEEVEGGVEVEDVEGGDEGGGGGEFLGRRCYAREGPQNTISTNPRRLQPPPPPLPLFLRHAEKNESAKGFFILQKKGLNGIRRGNGLAFEYMWRYRVDSGCFSWPRDGGKPCRNRRVGLNRHLHRFRVYANI